jgi:hypothetical protein
MRLFPSDDTLQVTVTGTTVANGTLQVRTEDGQVLWNSALVADEDGIARVEIPLGDLPPGNHHLVASGSDGPPQVLPFAIVPRSP